MDQGTRTPRQPESAGLAFANCPFHALVAEHTDLVCGMNLAIVEGMLGDLPPLPVAAVLDPGERRCCVRLAASGRLPRRLPAE